MDGVASAVRNGGSSQQINLPLQRWVLRTFQQWRTNIDSQMNVLEDNVTSIFNRVNQFVGTGQETISSRRLRRFMGKVQALTDKVNRLTQLLTENECDSSPCRNGGTCVDAYNGYICSCPSSWQGQTCESDVNECAVFAGTSFGCQNGATCHNSPGSYRCECGSNWRGVHCGERHDDCASASHQELCGHGHCVDEKRVQPGQPKYRCVCEAGWRAGAGGPACTEDVDECADQPDHCSRNPPVACINYPGSFRCGPCPAGYTGSGLSCSDVDECQVDNGGCSTHPMVACSNTVGSRNCGPCPPGYVGNGVQCTFVGVCAINRGGCHPAATCVENAAVTGTHRECRCPPGHFGDGEGATGCVAAAATTCADRPCRHGGTCQETAGSFRCACAAGYFGALCDRALDPCAPSPCENGGTCVGAQGSFSCVCPQPYEGPTCARQKESCGGYLTGENGTLRYPADEGREYGHRENCAWLITVDEGKVIEVTFEHLHLESSHDCEYDFVQLNDGSSAAAQLAGRFCGQPQVPFNLTSTHDRLYLWFHSDRSVAGTGFRIRWNAAAPVCGGILETVDFGAVNSPGYPGKYPRNRNCTWLVQVPLGKRIQFHFATLQIEHHENCSYDFVEVYDGASADDPLLSRYCSSGAPAPLLSSGQAALLRFRSDGSVQDAGFHITYAAVPGVQGCGGTLTAPSGSFSSPNFPDTYENRLNCEWLVRIHPGDRILLSFAEFHLEDHRSCNFDAVEVYGGESESAPLLGRYCGSSVPPDLLSDSHRMYVRFRTDSSVRHTGFRAQYRTVCGGVRTELTGSLSSPYFPDPYPSAALCVFDVRLPPGFLVNLTFRSFDLEAHPDCDYDYLQVRDGGGEEADPELGKFCGQAIPAEVVSSYNRLWAKFVTDGSVQATGFYADYEGIEVGCGGVLTEGEGRLSSPMHPDVYPHAVTCTWFLKAPRGHVVRLSFDSFSLEAHAECRFDHVQVRDSDGQQIGRYCGSDVPPVLTSTGSAMFVKFVADESVAREGFVASYVYLDATQSCGGDYYLESGAVRSPGYPAHYPPNVRCVWVLHAARQRQFSLNATAFRLESHADCRYDYLEVRNGGYETSPLIGRYCGVQAPPPITSHGNVIRLEFRTDSSQSAAGFEIYYDSATTGCGGTLQTPRGSIVSPNYPQSYAFNADCEWLIRTSQGSVVSLTVVDVDIEAHHACAYDYLQVLDGADENARPLLRICNNQQNRGAVVSTGNSMFLRFRSDFSESGRGFHLAYQTICNNVLTKRRGVIESPNFPNTYPHNHNCTWTITAPVGNNVSIAFSHIYMEGGASCDADYIEVLELHRSSNELTSLARYCGTPEQLPPALQTTSNTAVVRLVTDRSVAREGFRLEYAVLGCGGDIRDRSYGVISSPNYPNGYPFQTECVWHIWYPPGSRVELHVTDLDIETSDQCVFDYLRAYGGEDESAPRLLNACSKANGTRTVSSHGNQMLVHFYSDFSVTGKGFRAQFNQLRSGCGGRFTAESATILTPNHPSAYGPDDDCSWLIEVGGARTVVLRFYDFLMPASDNCTRGHVAVYDGDSSASPLLMRGCGSAPPSAEVSATANRMLVRMTADGVNVATGFRAHYETGCGARLSADGGGEVTSPNYPHPPATYHNCSWIVSASDPGAKVIVIVTHLDFPESDNCSFSSLAVAEGDEPDSPLAGRFCGSHAPPPILSRGRSLHLSLVVGGVFRATYGLADSHCGGDFSSTQGTFSTPGFPYSYPAGAECVWTISASAGNRVQISFRSFRLEESDHCNADYAEVHEGDAAGPLVGRYCGGATPANLTVARRVWIKFRSDEEGTEAGFLAHYELAHGTQLNGTEGLIESPGYPLLPLFRRQAYEWTVTVPFGLAVSVRFLSMSVDSVHESSGCVSSVSVYDGPDDGSVLMGQFCGYEVPEPVVSVGNVVFVRFDVQSYQSGTWRLRWVAVDRSADAAATAVQQRPTGGTGPSCWQEIFVNATGEASLDSPGFPTEYGPNLNCTYIVRAPPFDHVSIHFLEFELEGSSNGCPFDKIELFVAPDPAVDEWRLNETLCGRVNASAFRSPNHLLKVVFSTDSSVSRRGFHSVLRSDCGGQLSGTEGVLSSRQLLPRIRGPFGSLSCEWTIGVKSRRTIQLSFDAFDIPSDGVCSSNYILIRNGEQSQSPLLGAGKFCGSSAPSLPETSTDRALVRLVVASVAQGPPRFDLRFRELSVGCGRSLFLSASAAQAQFGSPGYPSAPPHDLECVWVVMSPAGTRMRIDFEEEFHMSNDCYYGDRSEYVELLDGGAASSPPLRRFCGHDQPSSVMTTGNALRATYVTAVEHPEAGFRATVRIAECGGTVSAYNALVQSPRHPQNYSSGLECEWSLKMRPGFHLLLEFLDLDTPPADNCTRTDYVEVRHHDAQGEVLALLCGRLDNDTRLVPVPGPQAYVKFKSDSSATGRGFKLLMQVKPDMCGERKAFDTPTGEISSPGYPDALAGRRECFWRVEVPEGRRATVRFVAMNLPRDQHSGHCLSYVRLSGWYGERAHTLCGNEVPAALELSWSNVYVHFYTSGLTAGQGFSLAYSTENEAVCGGVLQLPSGTISTPDLGEASSSSSPSPSEGDGVECKWRTAPEIRNRTVTVAFDVLDTPGLVSNYCRGGALYVYKGVGQYFGSYCGNLTGKGVTVSSSSASLVFKLMTSLDVARRMGGIRGTYGVSECGGELDGAEAVIESPGYPDAYPPNTTCLWTVTVPQGEEITLSTTDMRLEGDCDRDSVTVRNGDRKSSPVMGRFCGNRTVAPLTSSGNRISVLFRSDAFGSAPGFRMTTAEVQKGCSGVIHAKRGVVSSPNYPAHYGHNLECVWTVEFPHGFLVNLTFVGRFEIETANGCAKDYLLVEKSDDAFSWQTISRKCGRETPPPMLIDSRRVRLTFRSDSELAGDGFQIEFAARCGGHFTEQSGELRSPNHPHEYEDNLNCSYVVGQPGHYVTVEFDPESFSIEYHSSCMFDYVELFEGDTTAAPSLGKFCGDAPPEARTVLGPVLVHFVTDYVYVAHGFLARYEIIPCGAVFTEPTGVINTPTKPEGYMSDMDCKWHIQGQPNKVIALKFRFFEVQPSSSCYSDWLEIRDGNETGPVVGRLCGERAPGVVKSTRDRMTLHFHSDSWWNMRGFSAVYYDTLGVAQGCGGTLVAASGEFSSVDADSDGLYEPDLDCWWTLIGTDGDAVLRLEFAAFDVEASENGSCRYDYVEVKENMAPSDALVGRYCGGVGPDPIVAAGNKVSVHFHSDDKVNRPGFRIKFTSMPSPCGPSTLLVTRSLQTLTSPDYPQPYLANLRCRWNFLVNTSETDRVDVRLTDLDVPCDGDYLQVEEVPKPYSYHVRRPVRLCGPTHPKEIVGEDGLSLVLHSDSGGSGGRGFSLTYRLDECNRTYVSDNGNIFSPGFPQTNSPKANCAMTISAAPGKTVSLYFNTFYLAGRDAGFCETSGLRIYDGRNNSAPLLTSLCGYSYTASVFSTGRYLHLDLIQPGSQAVFFITYTTTDQGVGCGGPLTQDRGTFSSPFFPEPFNRTAQCSWFVSVPGYHAVSLRFRFLDLASVSGCETNYVELYEGHRELPDRRVVRLCGGDVPAPFTSQESQVLVKLVTSPSNTASGFIASYEAVEFADETNPSVLQLSPSPVTPVAQDGVLHLADD